MSKILIVVDMQNDFIDGPLGTRKAIAIVPKVQAKIMAGKYDKVIFTMDTHDENYLETMEGKKLPVKHCIVNTHGWEISNKVTNARTDESISLLRENSESGSFLSTIISKPTFGYTRWDAEIDDGDSVDIVGLCTDICVVSNAIIIKALFPENVITVDASCCAGTSPEKHLQALSIMESCHIDVINKEE